MLESANKPIISLSTRGYPVCLVSIDTLTRTEDHDQLWAEQLATKIFSEGVWTEPIVIDRESSVILDGHHRYSAAIRLGFKCVPCVGVDYFSENVTLAFWRDDFRLSKKEIVAIKTTGRVLPLKTTRHLFAPPIGLCRIDIDDLR